MAYSASHELDLVYGGTQYRLNQNNFRILEYVPQEPTFSTINTNSIRSDGGERPKTTYRNVNETATIMIQGSDASGLIAVKRNIRGFFDKARRYQEYKSGDPVYVQYKPANLIDTSACYRSEILSGKVTFTPESLDYRWTKGNTLIMNLEWTRRYYWEETDERQVALSNTTDNENSCGLRIFNHYDGTTHENYVEMGGTILGEIASPPRIEFYNSGSTTYPRRWFIASNVTSTPHTFDYVIEGEDGATSGYNASAKSDSDSSGGQYMQMDYSADPENYSTLSKWVISGSAVSDRANSNFFNVVARVLSSVSASVFARLIIQYPWSAGTTLYEGPEVEITTQHRLFSLGAIKIPPALYSTTTHDDMALLLQVRAHDAGTINLDYFQLFPINTGFRFVEQRAYQWSAGETFVIDEDKDEIYIKIGSASAMGGFFNIVGNKIFLHTEPSYQRLYFLFSETTNSDITRTPRVKLYYRPRVLTI